MKVADVIQRVDRFEVGKSREFQIAANAQTFKILSSTLYSDKPRAVIREICCNAWDAHVAAKNTDKPFHIKFPTTFDPTLAIRDYGTGLEPDALEEIYTTYFFSTKRDSDDFTGCLGLGTKSVLTYTNSFNVTNFYNGKKYTHVVYINERGTPEISLMATEDTKESNGLEVSFNVKPGDYYSFESAIRNVVRFFPVMPSISGKHIAITPLVGNFEKVTVNGKTYEYTLETYKTIGVNNGILMGNVLYPLNISTIPNLGRAHTLLSSLALKLNIGDVSVVASREGLEYDKKTINLLSDITKAIYDKLKGDFDKDIKKCVNEYEVKSVCGDYASKTNCVYGLVFESIWNGKLYNTENYSFEIPRHFLLSPARFYPSKDLYLIINDSFHRRAAKTTLLTQQHNISKYVSISLAEEYIEHDTFRYTGRNLAYKMADDIGIKRDKILFLSDAKLPKPPPKAKSLSITKIEANGTSGYCKLGDVKDGDYILITYNTIVYDTAKEKKLGHYAQTFVKRALECFPHLKKSCPVYVFNYSDLKHLKNLKTTDFCQEVLQELKKSDVKTLKARRTTKDTIQYEGAKIIVKCLRQHAVNKDILKEMDAFKTSILNTQENAVLGFYEKIFGEVALDKTPKDTYTILKDVVTNNYPMLVHLLDTWKYGNQFTKDVSDYINLVDNGRKV